MWNKEYITWKPISSIYEDSCDAGACSLTQLPKVTVRHIYPNNFDKMNVSYAAQVLSNTFAELLKHKNENVMSNFFKLMNKFFDMQ